MADGRCQAESGAVSGDNAKNVKKKKDDRLRVYAGLIYPDSARPDWMERLDATHARAFVSPLHDRDVEPDGTLKKPHYHWMQLFEGKKSRDQLLEMWRNIAGEKAINHFVDIGSSVGYARYMIHLDNPEKAQYDAADVKCFGGIDYQAFIETTQDKKTMYREMGKFIIERGITSLAQFSAVCLESNLRWYDAMTIGRSYYFDQLIKDISRQKRQNAFMDEVGGRLARLEAICGVTAGGQPAGGSKCE